MAVTDHSILPKTPAGEMLALWLDAVNSGDFETIRRFISESHTAAALATRNARQRAAARVRTWTNTRGLTARRIVASKPHALNALLFGNLAEDWWNVRIEVEPDPPHHVKSLSLSPAAAPDDLREGGPLSPPEIAERLDAYTAKLADADIFSGAYLLARNGEVLTAGARGLASRAWKVPNTVQTRFNLGSCNKMFTSVAILQQIESGRIALDDRIGGILPDYPNEDVAANVTIRHLLTHTSGLGSFFNQQFAGASRARFRKVADYTPLYEREPLEFRPGARFSYSNSGMMLLGVILEKVTGGDYFEYIRERIYGPAGMTRSDSYDLDADEADIAVGYTSTGADGGHQSGPRRSNVFTHIAKGSPAGGGFSTVEDMLRFDQALRGNVLLKPETTALMLTPQASTDFDPSVKIGYGVFLEESAGKRIAGHSGVFAGVNSQLDMHLDTGFTAVILSNYDPPAAKRVAHKVREWVAGGVMNDE
ncbi:MAG TPA: serine hydrolase domain-containing protein [Armatimonadota bacterium]|jgi:CubicO group peptidase (beta-lactamase class C family)